MELVSRADTYAPLYVQGGHHVYFQISKADNDIFEAFDTLIRRPWLWKRKLNAQYPGHESEIEEIVHTHPRENNFSLPLVKMLRDETANHIAQRFPVIDSDTDKHVYGSIFDAYTEVPPGKSDLHYYEMPVIQEKNKRVLDHVGQRVSQAVVPFCMSLALVPAGALGLGAYFLFHRRTMLRKIELETFYEFNPCFAGFVENVAREALQ